MKNFTLSVILTVMAVIMAALAIGLSSVGNQVARLEREIDAAQATTASDIANSNTTQTTRTGNTNTPISDIVPNCNTLQDGMAENHPATDSNNAPEILTPNTIKSQEVRWTLEISSGIHLIGGRKITLDENGMVTNSWKQDSIHISNPTYCGYSESEDAYYLADAGRIICLRADGNMEIETEGVVDTKTIAAPASESNPDNPTMRMTYLALLIGKGQLSGWCCDGENTCTTKIDSNVFDITDAAYGCNSILITDAAGITYIQLIPSYNDEFSYEQVGKFERLGRGSITHYQTAWNQYCENNQFPTISEFVAWCTTPMFTIGTPREN